MIVDLLPSEEQQLIEDSLRGFLRERLPVERLRDPAAAGGQAEQAVWHELSAFGLFGMALPEGQGGQGLGLAEEALVARALGAYLISPAILAQIAAPMIASDEGVRAALIAGEERAAFASLGGHLIDGARASQVVLISPQGAALVPVSRLEMGANVRSIDETVALRRLISASSATLVDGFRVSLLLAAYLTGLAQAATSMAVEYAKTREQFGQPIGAFQAIKHLCADMATRAAAANAQVFYAAVAFGRAPGDAAEVSAARLLAADAAIANAKANVQIHGGMGFTAECDAHLFLKRAHVLAMFGTSRAKLRNAVLG